MRVPHGSYVLVADGRKRLFARNDGDADAPLLSIVGAAEDKNPLSREQGMSQKEIAHHMRISENTVESHLKKALKYLRTNLRLLFTYAFCWII